MIDTVKFAVPLTKGQHERIAKSLKDDQEQWAKVKVASGRLIDYRLLRVQGLFTADRESYHREIAWDTRQDFVEGDTWLTVELSIPKFWQKQNIHLLNNFEPAIALLRDVMNDHFGLKGRAKLCDYRGWKLKRLDICYAWNLKTYENCHALLLSLQQMKFPHKDVTKRSTSISFLGRGKTSSYSAKFYEKLPEFEVHDERELAKQEGMEYFIQVLKGIAAGVLRFEVTLRWRWLKNNDLTTVSKLLEPQPVLSLDAEARKSLTSYANEEFISFLILTYHASGGLNHIDDKILEELGDAEFREGVYKCPAIRFTIVRNGRSFEYDFGGGSLIVTYTSNAVLPILQTMLKKIVGLEAQLQDVDQVKAILMANYKPVKASRLTSFWMFLQQYGADETKRSFGKNSFYDSLADLKEVGVTLLEDKTDNGHNNDFLRTFRLTIPSQFVVNSIDNDRATFSIFNAGIQDPMSLE